MKNFLKKFILCLLFINLALVIQSGITLAQEGGGRDPALMEDIKPMGLFKQIGIQTDIEGIKEGDPQRHGTAYDIEPGVASITSPIYFIVDLMRLVLSGIAILVIIISAIKLITIATEEEATKTKTTFITAIVGLLVIQLADVAVKRVFFGEQGEVFETIGQAQYFAEEGQSLIRGITGLITTFVATVAVLVIIFRGITLIYSLGEEDAQDKAKKHVMYAIIGLIAIGLADLVIRGFIFPAQGPIAMDTRTGFSFHLDDLPRIDIAKAILVRLTNFVSGFVALLAFVVLFYGGYMYVVSGGKEDVNDKVKKNVFGATIALVLAASAYAIVNTFITIGETIT